jgi:hypothetical protein
MLLEGTFNKTQVINGVNVEHEEREVAAGILEERKAALLAEEVKM